MRILHLTLNKKWFDMIVSDIKKEEYREMKPYWETRLIGKEFDIIRFKNGYAKDCLEMDVEFKGVRIASGGKAEWGANPQTEYYIISLGKILSTK